MKKKSDAQVIQGGTVLLHNRYVVSGLLLIILINRLFAQCSTIDAVTSASFKVTGGQACSTFAKINWKYTRNNGTMTIEWGPSTTYGKSKSVYSSNPVEIPDLTPNTKYYYHVYGIWKNKTYQYTSSSFTTSGKSLSINQAPLFTSTTTVACTTGKSLTYKITATDPDNDPLTFTVTNKPDWINFSTPNLILQPTKESSTTTLKIIVSDNKGGLDTLNLAITITPTTSIFKTADAIQSHLLWVGNNRISIPVWSDRSLKISLYSLNGREIISNIRELDNSSHQTSITTNNLVPGIYLLKISTQFHSSQHSVFVK